MRDIVKMKYALILFVPKLKKDENIVGSNNENLKCIYTVSN
jgi:hypothetical protein